MSSVMPATCESTSRTVHNGVHGTGVAHSLDASEWATPVPCTPLWTVRDVLSHVAGITDDITNGRTEGAASDPWTAAQVERWRDADPGALIDQWNGQIGAIAELLERVGEH